MTEDLLLSLAHMGAHRQAEHTLHPILRQGVNLHLFWLWNLNSSKRQQFSVSGLYSHSAASPAPLWFLPSTSPLYPQLFLQVVLHPAWVLNSSKPKFLLKCFMEALGMGAQGPSREPKGWGSLMVISLLSPTPSWPLSG